jgi:hypothetical protein
LDMHKSKFVIAQLQSFSKGKTYVSLVFFTNLGKTMFENNFREGNYIQGHNHNTKHFNHTLSTNCKGKWFFIIKSARFSTNIFCSKSSFLKGSFEAKNSNMEELQIRDLLFANCLFIFSFVWLLIFLSVATQWGNICKLHLPTISTYSNASVVFLLGNK